MTTKLLNVLHFLIGVAMVECLLIIIGFGMNGDTSFIYLWCIIGLLTIDMAERTWRSK